MTDIVLISLEAWDDVWRRNQHLVAGLLRSDPRMRVLFVEPAADPLHDARRRTLPHRGRGLRRGPDVEGVGRDALWLHQSTKLLPRRVDRRVDLRRAEAIAHAAERLGLTRPLLWVNDPSGAATLTRTGWPALYDITDDWLVADRTPAEHARLEVEEALLLDRAAEVVVCSPELARTKGRTRPVTLIRNAVDTAAYRTLHARPDGLPPGPAAVYVGTVHRDRIDVDLCVETSQALAGTGHLVLVGPALLNAADEALLRSAGVVLTGSVHRDDVPAYLQHADVLVVPHVVTPFTDSLDPIKVYEYAAAGRPVVSTPVAGFRDTAGPGTVLASGPDFVRAVLERVPATHRHPLESSPGSLASSPPSGPPVPDWADRVAEVRGVIDRVAAGPRGRPLA